MALIGSKHMGSKVLPQKKLPPKWQRSMWALLEITFSLPPRVVYSSCQLIPLLVSWPNNN